MLAEFKFKYDSPIICTAIHNGHDLSEFVLAKTNLSDIERFYEEDPFTEAFTQDCNNRLIAKVSRFQVDLNRSREKCIYINPEDAWGLSVRRQEFTENELDALYQLYDDFYDDLKKQINRLKESYKEIFVFDIHSYNYRRCGEEADPEKNPEIILGTSNMPVEYMPLIDDIKSKFDEFVFFGRKLDTRINVTFPGGYFPRWIHNNFDNVICVSIEFKKIFMDELAGEVHNDMLWELKRVFNTVREMIAEKLG